MVNIDVMAVKRESPADRREDEAVRPERNPGTA